MTGERHTTDAVPEPVPGGKPAPPPRGPTLDDWAARGRTVREQAEGTRSGHERASPLPAADSPGPPGPPGESGESRRRAPSPDDPMVMKRRTALKVLAAAAAVPAIGCEPSARTADAAASGAPPQPESNPLAAGTLTDPDLLAPLVPWDMLLTEGEMATVAALADMIIPADERSPSATAVGAHHFVNEWVSAPYEGQARDLVLVRGGLVWLNAESVERFDRTFSDLSDDERGAILDDIRYLPEAAPEFRTGARFFDKMRDLVATGFWTTDEGMVDLGYQGNVPLPSFDGPPRDVLDRLGLS